jgi:hypothetical protein
METKAIDGRCEILKDCLANFIMQIYTTAKTRDRPIRRRELVRVLRQTATEIRARYKGPLLEEDARRVVNSLTECIAKSIVDKIIMKDFIEDFLGGQPIFDIKTVDTTGPTTSDLIAVKQDSFSVWQFILDDRERKQYLAESVKQGVALEKTLKKNYAGTFLFDPKKAECSFVPFTKEVKGNFLEVQPAILAPIHEGSKCQEVASCLQNDRAAVIILDVEGQFGCQMTALQNKVNEICAQTQMECGTSVEIFRVPFNATLSLKELNPKDLEYFMSKLTVKSRDHFLVALENVQNRGPIDSSKFFEEIAYEIEANQITHQSIKKSLSSALMALKRVVREVFDDKLKTPLEAQRLMVPGKITVIDVSTLDDEDKRYVAIYLLAILDRQKREFCNPTRTVLIFDEAHKLFPQMPPKSEKDYVERVNTFVSDIVHRGRKRKYSVVISTQSPDDVSKEISKLCDTTILFEVSSQKSWIRDLVSSPEARKKIGSLNGVGVAHVVCKGTPMLESAPKVRFPHIAKLYETNEFASWKRKDCNDIDCTVKIGKIIHREKTPLEISIDESVVQGHISSKYAALAHPPQVLVAKPDNEEGRKIFCKVFHLESKPWSVRDEEKQVNEFVTYVELQLIREIDQTNGYIGSPRNQNLQDFGLHIANEEEVKTCFNLPEEGFPLGKMLLSEVSDQTTLYYYPYNPNNYQRMEDEWMVDHSLFIVGNQGRGKTNALFYISLLLACNSPETIGTVIINLCDKDNKKELATF